MRGHQDVLHSKLEPALLEIFVLLVAPGMVLWCTLLFSSIYLGFWKAGKEASQTYNDYSDTLIVDRTVKFDDPMKSLEFFAKEMPPLAHQEKLEPLPKLGLKTVGDLQDHLAGVRNLFGVQRSKHSGTISHHFASIQTQNSKGRKTGFSKTGFLTNRIDTIWEDLRRVETTHFQFSSFPIQLISNSVELNWKWANDQKKK